MKATELLKQQHREVEQLFAKIENGGEPIQELLEELADNLAAHTVIEEQLFYPTVKRTAEGRERAKARGSMQSCGVLRRSGHGRRPWGRGWLVAELVAWRDHPHDLACSLRSAGS